MLEDRSTILTSSWIDHVRYAVRDWIVMFAIRTDHDAFLDVYLHVND
jgi:hypothetical protein